MVPLRLQQVQKSTIPKMTPGYSKSGQAQTQKENAPRGRKQVQKSILLRSSVVCMTSVISVSAKTKRRWRKVINQWFEIEKIKQTLPCENNKRVKKNEKRFTVRTTTTYPILKNGKEYDNPDAKNIRRQELFNHRVGREDDTYHTLILQFSPRSRRALIRGQLRFKPARGWYIHLYQRNIDDVLGRKRILYPDRWATHKSSEMVIVFQA